MAEYEDLMELGFEEENPPKPKRKRRKAPPKKEVKPVVVKQEIDTSAQVVAQAAAEAIKDSNAEFKRALNELVTKIEPRPKRMKVAINRNSAGFMDSFDIDVEY